MEQIQSNSLPLSQSSFSARITSQPTLLSVMFGVCISSATSQPSHKYNPPSLWFNNTHTSLSVSPFFFPTPLLSLPVCVSLLSSSYLLSVGPSVCLSVSLSGCVSIFVPRLVCVRRLKCLCFSRRGCLCVCLCSRSGMKTNHFKSPSRASVASECVLRACARLPGQFALMSLSDWRKSIRAF